MANYYILFILTYYTLNAVQRFIDYYKIINYSGLFYRFQLKLKEMETIIIMSSSVKTMYCRGKYILVCHLEVIKI